MNKLEKTQGEKLQDQLSYKNKNSWLKMNQPEKDQTFTFCQAYIDFFK